MLSIAREQLGEQLQRVPALLDLHARGEAEFPARAAAWLRETEECLSRLRNPRAARLATARGKIAAALAGHAPEPTGKLSPRKQAQAAALAALEDAELALRDHLVGVDQRLDESRAKVAQLLAVATGVAPIPMPPSEPRTAWLRKVWLAFAGVAEVRQLYVFLNATVRQVDLLYLLDELLGNLIQNLTPPPEPPPEPGPIIVKPRPGPTIPSPAPPRDPPEM